MQTKSIDILALVLLLAPLLAACGAAAAAQQEPPTPTPLPPEPALERPTYIVQRGTIERPLDANGRIAPVDLAQLAFRRAGRIAKVNIHIVLERKERVLWLPPDAVRAFEGRRFVVVQEGDRERRATVKVGIETTDKVEILEGVKEGHVVVGQ
jgi:multidrug efflux pump subunit AcrA (membrane-fusion protein)